MNKNTRLVEEKMAGLFAVCKPFSEHMRKWEDDCLPDKYDHNCFEYRGQPSLDEFRAALAYQENKGAAFIKLEGDAPLQDAFGLDAGVTLTMLLGNTDRSWRTNSSLSFHTPSIEELDVIELKHYRKQYGEDFTRRNIRRLYDKYSYHGAYSDGKLVGSVYSYTDPENRLTCIDGMIVDADYRKQYIATSLIAHVRALHPDTSLFLHADEDDTPKEMYLKMGFEIVDRLYEYLCISMPVSYQTAERE